MVKQKGECIMKTRIQRFLAVVLSLALALSFIPVTGRQADTARAAALSNAVKAPESGSKKDQKIGAYQPKHKLAKAVDVMKKAESGELEAAVEEIAGTDGYYDALSANEKRFYHAIIQVYTCFRPFSSSNEFYDKARSARLPEDALAEDIANGSVGFLQFENGVTKDEVKDMFSMASNAYRFDHPYNLLCFMYKLSYIRFGSKVFLTLCHIDNTEDFDYNQWGRSLVQFEESALTEIVNDDHFSETSAPIKEYLVHEYICGNVKYDYSKPGTYTIQFNKSKSAYGPMVEHLGVCIGISYMAKILLDDLEVRNYVVHSATHAWNVVLLDGNYYELDCTWDLDSGKGIKYKYFNRTTNEITTLDTSGAHIRATDSMRVPLAMGVTCTYDYICQLLAVSDTTDQNKVEDPKYASDDYVDDEEGELYPNQENYEYNGLLFSLFSEGYAVCSGVVGNPKSIDIPDSVIVTDEEGTENYYQVIMIDTGAFAGKKKLKKATLAGTLAYVGEKAFYKCSNLKTITLNSVEDMILIEKNAFKGIAKTPTFCVYADKTSFKKAKKLIKAGSAPKKAKYKRLTV